MDQLTGVELIELSNPSAAVPLPTIERAFCAGPRTTEFSMLFVWFGVNSAWISRIPAANCKGQYICNRHPSAEMPGFSRWGIRVRKALDPL